MYLRLGYKKLEFSSSSRLLEYEWEFRSTSRLLDSYLSVVDQNALAVQTCRTKCFLMGLWLILVSVSVWLDTSKI